MAGYCGVLGGVREVGHAGYCAVLGGVREVGEGWLVSSAGKGKRAGG